MTRNRRAEKEEDADAQRYPSPFLPAMREAVAAVGWQISKETDTTLECLDVAGEKRIVGLENFYRRVQNQTPADWPGLLQGHLQAVAPGVGEGPQDLNAVLDRIFPRVGRPFSHIPGMSLWTRPIEGTDLVTMLVITHDGSLKYVNQEEVEASGRSGDEWYAQAVTNLREHTPPGSLRVLEPNSGLLACSLGDAHDASRSLIVESLLPQEAPEGVLIGVPNRDTLVALPVNSQSLRHLALLKVFTGNQHEEDAYPITPDIYWVRRGCWYPLGIELTDEGVQLDPASDLVEDLHRLLSAEEGEQAKAPVPFRLREEDYEAPAEVPFTSPQQQADYRRGHRAGWQAFADNARTHLNHDGYQEGYIPGLSAVRPAAGPEAELAGFDAGFRVAVKQHTEWVLQAQKARPAGQEEWQSPIGRPDRVDMIATRQDGVVQVVVVTARALDPEDSRTAAVLEQKLRNYCRYINHPSFAEEFGTPTPEKVKLVLRSDWEVPEAYIRLLARVAREEQVLAGLEIRYE